MFMDFPKKGVPPNSSTWDHFSLKTPMVLGMPGVEHCDMVPTNGFMKHVWNREPDAETILCPLLMLFSSLWRLKNKITLLRVIPTMTFIRFVAGKSSGILSGISSGTLSDISSGISSDILSGKSSGVLSGKIWQTFWHFIWHTSWHSIWHSTVSGVLSGISSGILSGRWGPRRCPLSSEGPRLRSSGAHWALKVPGWGPVVPTGLGRFLVGVQWCPLGSEGPQRCPLRNLAVEVQPCPLRLVAGSWGPAVPTAHGSWWRALPGWGPAVPTAIRTWRLRSSRAHSDRKPAVEVQQCPLRAEVGEEIGDELARRKWMWKLNEVDADMVEEKLEEERRREKRRRRRRRRRRRTALIKSNNPHLAGGEQSNTVKSCPRGWTDVEVKRHQATNNSRSKNWREPYSFVVVFLHVLLPSNKRVPQSVLFVKFPDGPHVPSSQIDHILICQKGYPKMATFKWKLIIHYQIFSRPPRIANKPRQLFRTI